jgi:hypothetical protein
MIKTSLFADQEREAKLNKLGDALRVLEQHGLSFQRFVGLRVSSQIPDRTTIWTFKKRSSNR